MGNIHPTEERGKWEFQAEGTAQLTARIVSTFWKGRGAWHTPGQEATSSGRDVGNSSLIDFLGGHVPGQRNRAEMGPDGHGEGLGQGAAGWCSRVFWPSGLLTASWSGPSSCDSPPQLQLEWHGGGQQSPAAEHLH